MAANLQDALIEFEENPNLFATLIKRIVALLLDGLVLSPLIVLNLYNQGTLKSIVVFIAVALIQITYKPFFEYRYGATPGKMMLKLQVVNTSFRTLSLTNAVMRDIIQIAYAVFTLVAGVMVFTSTDLSNVHSYTEFAVLQRSLINPYWLLTPYAIFGIIDIICVLSDKNNQSLHDRIGDTLVINKQSAEQLSADKKKLVQGSE